MSGQTACVTALGWWDLGHLERVDEHRWKFDEDDGTDGLVALRLTFADGAVKVEATGDDTILVTHAAVEPSERSDWSDPVDVSFSAPWEDAIGRPVLWARRMVNHNNWEDGYQFEFGAGADSIGVCIDVIAIVSGLRVGRTNFFD